MLAAQFSAKQRYAGRQYLAVEFDVQRKPLLIVMNGETVGVVLQHEFAVLETSAIEFSEERSENSAAHGLVGVIPLNIEKPRKRRIRPILQNIRQQAIVAIVGHVIGDDILNPTHI